MSRRAFVRTASLGAALLAARPLAVESVRARVSRIPFPAPVGHEGLRGLRLAFVSDIHRSRLVSRARVEAAAELLAQEKPDVLILGGDLITGEERRPALMDEVLQAFGQVGAPLGRFAVRGNHELKAGEPERIFRSAERFGFQALDNASARVSFSGATLHVVGLDDSTRGHPRPERAFADLPSGEPVLLVSHNPDVVVDHLQEAPPTWLCLAGHLHGGQIRLPLTGAVLKPTHYPELFDMGFAEARGRTVYVSRGLGEVRYPVRTLCPPELCLFEIS